MIAPKHILGTFDEALSSLRNNVLMMSSLTERSLDRAITGLLQRDDKLCAIAIADDEEIDQLEKQVDKDGIDLLLRFSTGGFRPPPGGFSDEALFQSGAHGGPGDEHRAPGAQA